MAITDEQLEEWSNYGSADARNVRELARELLERRERHCDNCLYWDNGMCDKHNIVVKGQFFCAGWESGGSDGKAGR